MSMSAPVSRTDRPVPGSRADGGKLAFELRYPDGQHVRIYLDGRVEGVPEGTCINNLWPAHLDCLAAHLDLARQDLDNLLPSHMIPVVYRQAPPQQE